MFIVVAGCQIMPYNHVMAAAAPIEIRKSTSSLLEMPLSTRGLLPGIQGITADKLTPLLGPVFSGPPDVLPEEDYWFTDG